MFGGLLHKSCKPCLWGPNWPCLGGGGGGGGGERGGSRVINSPWNYNGKNKIKGGGGRWGGAGSLTPHGIIMEKIK